MSLRIHGTRPEVALSGTERIGRIGVEGRSCRFLFFRVGSMRSLPFIKQWLEGKSVYQEEGC